MLRTFLEHFVSEQANQNLHWFLHFTCKGIPSCNVETSSKINTIKYNSFLVTGNFYVV